MVRCQKHKRYKGKSVPKSMCPECWSMFTDNRIVDIERAHKATAKSKLHFP